jgi:hypothetical protein
MILRIDDVIAAGQNQPTKSMNMDEVIWMKMIWLKKIV